MIVLDTTVLVYAVGGDHRLAAPCRDVLERVADGRLRVTTTLEVLQEFAHVRARRWGREDAAELTRGFAVLLGPLLQLQSSDLELGLDLFRRTEQLGAFDAVLAAATKRIGAAALMSADRAFREVPGITVLDPADAAFSDSVRDHAQ